MSMNANMSRKEATQQATRLVASVDAALDTSTADLATLADNLRAAARRLFRVSIDECNGVIGHDGFARWNEDDQAKADKKREAATHSVRASVENALGASAARVRLEFQGDPRGAMIVAHVADTQGEREVARFW